MNVYILCMKKNLTVNVITAICLLYFNSLNTRTAGSVVGSRDPSQDGTVRQCRDSGIPV